MKKILLVTVIVAAFVLSQSLFAAELQSKKGAKASDKKGKKEATVKKSTDTPPPPPGEMKKSASVKKSTDKIIGKSTDGKPIYEGPKGGHYTINAKGEKVYLKMKH